MSNAVPSPEAYELARPIFRPSQRNFDPLARMQSWRQIGNSVVVNLETRSGRLAFARITFASPSTARLQWQTGSPPLARITEMLTGAAPEVPLTISEQGGEIRISAGGEAMIVRARPWHVTFGPYRGESQDTSLIEWIAEPSGVATEGAAEMAYETFALDPGEELFGLGERFLGPRLRGHRFEHWITEPYGTNTADLVYKSVPLVISTRGYGLFFHHSERATFDIGAGSTSSGSVLVQSSTMDIFILLGEPKAVISDYTALTGRAPVPPEWTFGIWMSRCMYESRHELENLIAEARRVGCEFDVINLDPLWLKHRKDWGIDSCDFVVDEAKFGPMSELTKWLHDQDIRLCLWVNPHLMEGSEAWLPERLVDGGRARDPIDPRRGFVDLTGGGRAWWIDEMRRLVAAGVDCFKLDYGELLPASATMGDGRSGGSVHNLYPLLGSIVARESGVPVVFTRSGTAGSQRYPLHWAGDSQSSWAGMAGALRGGLSASWSGFAHWTSDVGGFYCRDLWCEEDAESGFRQVAPELYIRWMQMGMLSSHTRFHGVAPREPWHFGEEAMEVYRRFAAIRRRLRPYLIACSREAAETGCPIMRGLALEFPLDRGSRDVDTEYMLGPDLLVCPVLRPTSRVDLYVPPGTWVDHFTGERFDGPRWRTELEVPLDRLPLLVREGKDPIPLGAYQR